MSTVPGSFKVLAALFALLAVSNFLKPLAIGDSTGFVFFGQRLSGSANTVVAPLFGAFLAAYAWSIWKLRAIAIPMGVAYAAYVAINLVLFPMRTPQPDSQGMAFIIVYCAVAIGVSSGAVYILSRNRQLLT